MSRRKGLSKKIRFEVFKRDKFTCQYCGAKAPDVVLHVDHIEPVANGGSSDILNLITSCSGCNLGKGKVPLSDTSAIETQRAQLEELQERREQIELLLKWRESLADHADDAIGAAARLWEKHAHGWEVSETGRKTLGKHIKRYGLELVLEAISESAEQYLEFQADENGRAVATEDSYDKAWGKIGAICYIKKESESRPNLRQAAYIGGIINRRFGWEYAAEVRSLAEECLDRGADFDSIKRIATSCDWPDALIERLEAFVGGAGE